MISVKFDEVNVEIGKDQEQYETIHAYANQKEGSLTFCFQLNKEEIDEIVRTGKIWHKQMNFGKPMNPIAMAITKDELVY